MGKPAPLELPRSLMVRTIAWQEQIAHADDIDTQTLARLNEHAEGPHAASFRHSQAGRGPRPRTWRPLSSCGSSGPGIFLERPDFRHPIGGRSPHHGDYAI